jgi:hypothetical protein
VVAVEVPAPEQQHVSSIMSYQSLSHAPAAAATAARTAGGKLVVPPYAVDICAYRPPDGSLRS